MPSHRHRALEVGELFAASSAAAVRAFAMAEIALGVRTAASSRYYATMASDEGRGGARQMFRSYGMSVGAAARAIFGLDILLVAQPWTRCRCQASVR